MIELDAWAQGLPVPTAPEADTGAEPTSLLVTLDTGDRIHYLDWGSPAEDAPALLLVHGLAQTAWAWLPIARRLARSVHVLAPDLRGHGHSDAPRAGYDLRSLAYDVLTVLVASGYGGRGRAILAGHGFGAIVAAVAASIEPRTIGGVTLIDGGWEDIAESSAQTPADVLRALGDPPEVTRTMDAFLADRREWDPRTWDADQERAARATVDQKAAGHVAPVARPHVLRASVEAMFEYRPLEVLPALDTPLLVVIAESGTADDESARERGLALQDVVGRRRDARVPATRVLRFPGVGHNLMRYRPAELSAELLAIARLAAR